MAHNGPLPAAVPSSGTFGNLLRQFRQRAGLTQEELAARADLSVRSISDLERGVKHAPQRATVQLLVSALGLTVDEREELERSVQRRRGAYRVVNSGGSTVPEPPTPLVGRQRDVAEAAHRLRWGGVRFLTLTGPGGVGKTRVAIAVARALQDDATDGLLYVSLASLRDARLVAASILRDMGLKDTSGRPAEEQLVFALRERDVLLVLDNFEHLTEAAPLLVRLLSDCRQVRLLLTSRTSIKIQGEHRFELAPLEVPGKEKLANLETVARYPAVELFVQRARAIRRDFELSEDNLQVVAEICRRLDGLPLAIELAAARISLLPLQALLMRLDQRLRLLTEGASDLPDRQRTMADAIAWSYALLDESGQSAFRQLSIFAGGWSLEAAAVVVDAESTEVLGRLGTLVDSSLVVADELEGLSGHPEPRYRMLETIREYGAEQLAASGEQEAARERHANFYLALAERAAPMLTAEGANLWWTRLDAEQDNLRASLHWTLEHGAVEMGLRLGGALWRYWFTRGYFNEVSENRTVLERILTLDCDARSPIDVRAQALYAAGALAYSQCDYAPATDLFEQSLALQREAGNVQGTATLLNALGALAVETGAFGEAQGCLEESIALRRKDGPTFELGAALNNLANSLRYQGHLRKAASLYEECLAVYRTCGLQKSSATETTQNNLAQLSLLQGDYERARRLSENSLDLARETGNPFNAAEALQDLGNLAIEHGDLDTAEARYEEALAIFRSFANTGWYAVTLASLADLARARGDYGKARRLGIKSLEQLEALGNERCMTYALLYLGDIAREQHQGDEASTSYRRALSLSHRMGYVVGIADCLEHLAWLEMGRQKPGQAALLGGAVDALRDRIGLVLTPAQKARHREILGGAHHQLGEMLWMASWERGRDMSLEEAIAYALDEHAQ